MSSTKEDSDFALPDVPNREDFDSQWYLTSPDHAFEAQSFWSAYRPWLARHGYTLFDTTIGLAPPIPYWVPPTVAVSAPVPYAFYHRDEDTPLAPWRMMWVQARFAFGQDTEGRNIAIKVIKSDSDEEKICNHLLQCSDLFHPDTFANVLPPVSIFKLPHQLSFVVMPMWSDQTAFECMRNVREVMNFVTDILRGLAFLHSQRIAHRDISLSNMMVNLFSAVNFREVNRLRPVLEKHRSSSHARYCLFDFNLSIQFPPGKPVEGYRSPSKEAYRGTDDYHPWDVYQGQFEYNPFAFDVGCLGNVFKSRFADVIPAINMLAPLIDRMTTYEVSERFTAAQAYEFGEGIVRAWPNVGKESLPLLPKPGLITDLPHPERCPILELDLHF
ncbi:hypothetical protein A0H81_06460 [Grifola frondosa]|uniref:Protein kinase domain-containing protein n=1 Tax=Grifola frondosa TaxID=5627 RepID=A0A1C7MB57_GRIFR|nr:hypothetical protein A0H81_06460 [Grifola frondosa]